MKAFNYNIVFASEPTLNDGISDPLLETIRIVEAKEPLNCTRLKYRSGYEEWGNSRQVRYCAEREFTQCLDRDCTWALEIKPIVTFVWQAGRHTIAYEPHTHFTPKLLEMWTLSLLLIVKFTLEDKYDMFHAAAIEVEGKCIAFKANCRGGKSTLTDYFVRQGYTMFSDDILGIYHKDETYFAVPSYPYLQPNRQIEDLGHSILNIAEEPKPLKAIYLLKKVKPDAPILIEKVTGIEKFNSFHDRSFLELTFLNQYLFKKQCRMTLDIPVYRITVPWNKKRLEEVKCAILATH